MTSTRKTLLIAGGLVAAAGTAYVMLLRADHRAIEDAGIGDSAAPLPRRPRATITRCRAPSRRRPRPPRSHRNRRLSRRRPAPAPAAPAATARVDAAPAVPVVSDKPQPVTKPRAAAEGQRRDRRCAGFDPPSPPPAAKPVQQAAPAPAPRRSRTCAAQARRPRTPRGRSPSATKSETPETAALVRESAKLDPSLPPPSMSSVSSMPASTGSYRQGSSSSGANPVAAAMTEQLVRQSSSFKSTAPAPADGSPTATK